MADRRSGADAPEWGGSAAFEALAAEFDYPMFVVTTAQSGELAGCLVGFATQISIDPARFLVGISNKNQTYRVAARADRLAVHVLDRTQVELATLFGEETGDEVAKFDRCRWQPGPGGVPVLADALGWFSGPILERIPLGDHVGYVLAPDTGAPAPDAPTLLSFRDVRDLRPGHPA